MSGVEARGKGHRELTSTLDASSPNASCMSCLSTLSWSWANALVGNINSPQTYTAKSLCSSQVAANAFACTRFFIRWPASHACHWLVQGMVAVGACTTVAGKSTCLQANRLFMASEVGLGACTAQTVALIAAGTVSGSVHAAEQTGRSSTHHLEQPQTALTNAKCILFKTPKNYEWMRSQESASTVPLTCLSLASASSIGTL